MAHLFFDVLGKDKKKKYAGYKDADCKSAPVDATFMLF
jgi:hypothetical protein